MLFLDEACGRNIVNSTACCSLNYMNTFRPKWMLELLRCSALRCSHCGLFCSSAFSHFPTDFFSHFVFILFSYFALTLFSSKAHSLCHTIFHCSDLMKRLGETLSVLLPVLLLSIVFSITRILFVLDDCRNFFSVVHFGAAILVFSARFGAAFYFFNFAFISTA